MSKIGLGPSWANLPGQEPTHVTGSMEPRAWSLMVEARDRHICYLKPSSLLSEAFTNLTDAFLTRIVVVRHGSNSAFDVRERCLVVGVAQYHRCWSATTITDILPMLQASTSKGTVLLLVILESQSRRIPSRCLQIVSIIPESVHSVLSVACFFECFLTSKVVSL